MKPYHLLAVRAKGLVSTIVDDSGTAVHDTGVALGMRNVTGVCGVTRANSTAAESCLRADFARQFRGHVFGFSYGHIPSSAFGCSYGNYARWKSLAESLMLTDGAAGQNRVVPLHMPEPGLLIRWH
jgi:hypothetical protein